MATRRALIREADLRRMARVAREEGVAIHSRLQSDGSMTLQIDPFPKVHREDSSDLDDRLNAWAAS